ncbi:MAG: DUF1566 domain-containing protein, partial [Proteobacteria bacterium]|nr:DUF1566 domain-containing protein [Pseudomonadota bacterium]
KDNTYTLAEAQDTFISQLNNQNFGGRNDWRIPTVQELAGLVDSSNFNPAINTVYFPNTLSDYYWSSDTKASSNTMAWLFYFLSGVVWSGGEQYAGHVMAVSGLPAVNVFIDNNDGTITDLSTGLMWQKYALSDYTWEQALTFCENLNMAGYKDWRLPTWKELLSILDYSSYNPAINITFFPGTEPGWYWSSTTYMANHSLKWNVLFDYGQVLFSNGELNNYYVRAVRGGQGGSIQNNVISGQVSIKDLGLGNVTMTLSGAAQRTTISKPPYYGTFSFDYIA